MKYLLNLLIALLVVLIYIVNPIASLIPFFIFVLTVFLHANKLNPLLYLFIGWGTTFAFYLSGILVYNKSIINLNALLYLLSAILVLTIGFVIGNRKLTKSRELFSTSHKAGASIHKPLIKIINTLAFLGIIAVALFAFDILIVNKVNILDFSLTRDIFTTRDVMFTTKIAYIIAPCGFIAYLIAIIYWDQFQKGSMIKLLWLSSGLLLSFFSILSAGRQMIFQIIVGTVMALAANKIHFGNITVRKKSKANLISIVLGLSVFIFLLSGLRNDSSISSNKIIVLMNYFNFNLSPELSTMLKFFPKIIQESIVETIVYFSHEIPQFMSFWRIDHLEPQLGVFSVPFIGRRLFDIGLAKNSVEFLMQYISSQMLLVGAMPVGWETIFSSFIIDFGFVGTFVVTFALGFMSGRIYYNYLNAPSLFSTILLIQINIFMFYTIMFPIFADTIMLFAFIFSLLLFVIELFNGKYKVILPMGTNHVT